MSNSKIKTVFLDVKPVPEKRRKSRRLSKNATSSQRNSISLYAENRPSLASLKSFANFKHDIMFNSIKPTYMFVKAIGALPIRKRRSEEAVFSTTSLDFFYSLAFFIGLLIYIGFVAVFRVSSIKSTEGRFEEAVIAYLFIINIFPVLIIPIMWAEAGKIAGVMNEWSDFEILYFQITGRIIPLDIRKKCVLMTIILPLCSGVSVIITHITMSDFDIVQVVPYCILDNLTVMLGALWYLMCESLSRTAYILAENFQKALRNIGPASMVADYRALWLRLSKLTRDTGTAFCYTCTYLNLYLFFIITLSIYGLMSQISEGFGIKDIGLAVTALSNICLLFFVCDEAHYASHHVRTNFQKKLLMVELSWMNSDAQTEINMFLRATEMNPSNINCGGFFDVNRNLFKSLLTTMVTYLVVLLQFQISIPEQADPFKRFNISALGNYTLN
ncbi:gustatory and odorant receptor 63a [Condylostylus longicornis]|uniref:gustatory and odorant receptor 63a n=1 Tax=Condylostylus longicornis TaxID=2530218 RepID=UPI00244DB69D|nr:gustatory and odorant receptor 63a [Condylostylus longicornis]